MIYWACWACLLLWAGIAIVLDAQETPGDQLAQSFIGGQFIGLALVIGYLIWRRRYSR